MDKQQLIGIIDKEFEAGTISSKDLMDIAKAHATHSEGSQKIIPVLYAIGVLVSVIGVVVLVGQNWLEIGFGGRILVTLGISLATYISGLLLRGSEKRAISEVMFTISAVLAPLGTYVLLNEGGITFDSTTQFLIGLVLAIVFGTAFLISKRNILILFTSWFASWAYFALLVKLFSLDYAYDTTYLKIGSLILGLAYILGAYGIKADAQALNSGEVKERNVVRSILYGFGTLGVLGAGISFGGFFDVIFILFIFAALYGSVFLKSRMMLLLGACFLVAHIIKLTSKYFVDSIGWPVALIGVGFFIIAVGYATVYVNRKFIPKT